MGEACSTYWGEERCIKVMVGKPREKDHLEDTGVDETIILSWIFRTWNCEAWTGLICLRIETGGELLRML
jgi:hypothetical protein